MSLAGWHLKKRSCLVLLQLIRDITRLLRLTHRCRSRQVIDNLLLHEDSDSLIEDMKRWLGGPHRR